MQRERGGPETEKAIQQALKAVTRGSTLHSATREHGAPYSTLHKTHTAMQGAVWEAYVETIPWRRRGTAQEQL